MKYIMVQIDIVIGKYNSKPQKNLIVVKSDADRLRCLFNKNVKKIYIYIFSIFLF